MFPVFADNERLNFLIQSLWPSGVIIVLVPLWTEIVRDVRDNAGGELYYILKEDIEKSVAPEDRRVRFLGYLLNEHDYLLSPQRSVRGEALDRLVAKFEDEGWIVSD